MILKIELSWNMKNLWKLLISLNGELLLHSNTQWGPERASQLKKGGVVQWLMLHFVDAMRLRFLMFVISTCLFLFVCPCCWKFNVFFSHFPNFWEFDRVQSVSIELNPVDFFVFWGDAEANSLTTCWQMSSGLHPSRPRHLRAQTTQTTWPRCLGLTWTVC